MTKRCYGTEVIYNSSKNKKKTKITGRNRGCEDGEGQQGGQTAAAGPVNVFISFTSVKFKVWTEVHGTFLKFYDFFHFCFL